MAEGKKTGKGGSSHGKGAAPPAPVPAAAPAAGTELGGRPYLYDSIDQFLRSHSNFESSKPLQAVMDEIAACKNLNEVFPVPLKHKLLGMDNALRFVLFLQLAPAEVNRSLEKAEPGWTEAARFSADAAVALVGQIYDLGVDEVVTATVQTALGFDDEDEDDEGADEGEGYDED